MTRYVSVFLLLSLAPALFAVNIQAITPSHGPAAGGTTVRIMGDFGPGPYSVVFGGIPAVSTTRLDSQTIEAVTPAHLPGESTVIVNEGGTIFPGGFIEFDFEGDPPEAFERILLPLFTPPVRGALGSEFRTTFAAWNASSTTSALVFGVERAFLIGNFPPIPPEKLIDVPEPIAPRRSLDSLLGPIIYSGTPGRFLYVRVDEARNLATNLRVQDITRSALNLGTELPVVRAREFVTSETLALTNVPIEKRFRNTLRIYATAETVVAVTFISGSSFGIPQQLQRLVHLEPGRHLFEPAYAQVGDFPTFVTNATPINVTISHAGGDDATPIWAFISVTNNETQAITTITPRR